jgi:hypothetical protein
MVALTGRGERMRTRGPVERDVRRHTAWSHHAPTAATKLTYSIS